MKLYPNGEERRAVTIRNPEGETIALPLARFPTASDIDAYIASQAEESAQAGGIASRDRSGQVAEELFSALFAAPEGVEVPSQIAEAVARRLLNEGTVEIEEGIDPLSADVVVVKMRFNLPEPCEVRCGFKRMTNERIHAVQTARSMRMRSRNGWVTREGFARELVAAGRSALCSVNGYNDNSFRAVPDHHLFGMMLALFHAMTMRADQWKIET